MTKKAEASSSIHFLIFSLLLSFGLSHAAWASDEFTRTSQGEVSGEIRKFQLYAPANLGGSVELQVGEEGVCLVDFECWARARNRDMAEEFTETVEMKLDIVDQVVTLRLITPRDAPWEGTDHSIKAYLDVYVPADIVVETKTRHFTLDISGPMEKVFVENDYGEILVSDVSEETSIRGTYNRVDVKGLQGKVDIETSYNYIRAEDIDTKGTRAHLETNNGEIELAEFTGQLEATTSYDPIYASGISLTGGRNEITTLHSKIDLDLERLEDCRLYLTNTYGDINLQAPKELSARLNFTVGRGGKIETNRILIRPLVLEVTRLEGICGQGISVIEADIEGIGRILLEGR